LCVRLRQSISIAEPSWPKNRHILVHDALERRRIPAPSLAKLRQPQGLMAGRPSIASAVDTSSAADELSPEPIGTVLRIRMLCGAISYPASINWRATPIT